MKLSIPIFIELLLQLLVGYADQMMINNYNELCVSAITNANTIYNLVIIVLSVLSVASIIMISQYKGANDQVREKKIYSLAIFLNLTISIALSIIIFITCPSIFTIMNISDDVKEFAIIYMRINIAFLLFQAIMTTFSAFLRSNDLMKETMIVAFIMNLINVFGNFLLIHGIGFLPELGIKGVAISSVLSRVIGAALMVIIFLKKTKIKVSIKNLRPFPREELRKLIIIGLPSSGESFSYSLSQLVIVAIINNYGDLIVNLKTFLSMFAMISYIFCSATSQAAQVIIGKMVGAQELDEANKKVIYTIKLSLIVATVLSVLMFIFSKQLLGIFTSNEEIIAIGQKIFFIEIFLEMGRIVNIVMVRALQTTGDIRFPVILSIICCWSIAVGFGYCLGTVLGLGLIGIWIGMACDEIIRGIIFIFRWKSGKWRQKHLI